MCDVEQRLTAGNGPQPILMGVYIRVVVPGCDVIGKGPKGLNRDGNDNRQIKQMLKCFVFCYVRKGNGKTNKEEGQGF